MDARAEIKGTTIQTRLEFVSENFGAEARNEALRELNAAFGEMAAGFILPMAWYPLAMDDHLCRFIQRKSGDPTEEAFRKLGEYSAVKHSRFFGKILGERRDPISFLSAIPHFHNTYDRGFGEMVLENKGERQADLKLPAPTEIYRSHCASTVSYLLETFHMISGSRMRAEEPACKARGNPGCIWRFRW
jgi:hypothetical protein